MSNEQRCVTNDVTALNKRLLGGTYLCLIVMKLLLIIAQENLIGFSVPASLEDKVPVFMRLTKMLLIARF